MTTQRRFPITGPKLKTRRNKFGRRYAFRVNNLVLRHDKRIRVWGLDKTGMWCFRDFKLKKLPKWLKRELRNVGKL